jgi:hypothetical protein
MKIYFRNEDGSSEESSTSMDANMNRIIPLAAGQ